MRAQGSRAVETVAPSGGECAPQLRGEGSADGGDSSRRGDVVGSRSRSSELDPGLWGSIISLYLAFFPTPLLAWLWDRELIVVSLGLATE